jgi:hypothetical protein
VCWTNSPANPWPIWLSTIRNTDTQRSPESYTETIYTLLAPMQFMIPSVYWPIAKLGFSKSGSRRRTFRRVFSYFYRKRVWNPLINSWAGSKGFDQHRFVFQNNIHALWSAIWLLCVAHALLHSVDKLTFCIVLDGRACQGLTGPRDNYPIFSENKHLHHQPPQ